MVNVLKNSSYNNKCNYFILISKSKVSDSKYGIIYSPITKVMVEPSESSSTTYQLHEGSKAKITSENENWYEISFNERKGWVKKIYVKKI